MPAWPSNQALEATPVSFAASSCSGRGALSFIVKLRSTVGVRMKYSLRPACDADYQYCYRLTKRNMLDLFRRHWGGWVPAEFRKGFNPGSVSVVVMSGRRMGYLSVKRDGDGIYIENIQLSSFVQGRGIGTEILEQTLNRHNDEVIRLTTFSDNPARRLYERLGFFIKEREQGMLRMARLPNKANAADAKSRPAD